MGEIFQEWGARLHHLASENSLLLADMPMPFNFTYPNE